MKKFDNAFLLGFVFFLFIMAYLWNDAEQRIEALDVYATDLQDQVDAANEVGNKQYYRGVYASCMVLFMKQKVPAAKATPFCFTLAKTAEEEAAHIIELPGYDDVGDAPQLAPTPVPDRPKPIQGADNA